MAQRTQIVAELKRTLKERGLTYTAVAQHLSLSVPSVKRLFSTGDFSLQRIDEVCDLAGLELSELMERIHTRAVPTKKLTIGQEQEIISDPKLFLITWLVLNRTQVDEILRDYTLTEREIQRYLIKLDRLKVIELQPMNKVKVLVSRHFGWLANGPVQRYIHQKVLKEFLATHFLDDREEFYFHGGAVTEDGLAKLKRVLQNTARECVEVIERDQATSSTRNGAAFVLALRPWQYSGFAQFMREEPSNK
ncbi:MAG: helix-turn-helix transcriptional regulator [Steroidobacteraceae bacterium]